MKSSASRMLVLLAFAAGGCFATPEFSAYMQAGQESKFMLADVEAAQSSGWLGIGETFKGYTLVSFDRIGEVLSLRKGEATIDLRLKIAHVRDEGASARASEVARQLGIAKDRLAEMRKRYRNAHPAVQAQLKKIAEMERELAK